MLTTRGLHPLRLELLVRLDAEGNLAAGGQQQHVGLASRRIGQDVGAFAEPLGRGILVGSRVGTACRVRMRQIGSCRRSMITFHASTTSLASHGRSVIRPGMASCSGAVANAAAKDTCPAIRGISAARGRPASAAA